MFECLFYICPGADSVGLFQKLLMRTGIAVSTSEARHLRQMPTSSSPHLLQSETLSCAVNYNHYSHTVPWDLKTEIFIFVHAYSTMRHHVGHSANLQKLLISSTVHGAFTVNPLKLLYWGRRVSGVVGCGCGQTSHQDPTTNTHIRICHGPLPCLPASMGALAFHSQQLHSSSGWCVRSVLHHYTEQRQKEFLRKTNAPRRPNLSLLLWQFMTGGKLYTPNNTHRQIHKNTDSTQNTRKKEKINLSQAAVCAFMCSTPFDSNPQEHETLCVPQEARKKKPTKISRLRNIQEQKQSNFTHQSEATQTGQDTKLLYRM